MAERWKHILAHIRRINLAMVRNGGPTTFGVWEYSGSSEAAEDAILDGGAKTLLSERSCERRTCLQPRLTLQTRFRNRMTVCIT
eukprot:1393793-Amorphochlora_amoeboformis.AAC.1